ncbi:MAG: S1 RNA-binding domain-containing protein, partial [Mycobacterium sp.]
VSAMADHFVSDPHEVVRSGQVVKVKVLDVDVERQRIGLSLRLNDAPPRAARAGEPERAPAPQAATNKVRKPKRSNDSGRGEKIPSSGSMAQALRDAGFGR